MEPKFKVGDRIRIRNIFGTEPVVSQWRDRVYFIAKMAKYFGQIKKVKEIIKSEEINCYLLEDTEACGFWVPFSSGDTNWFWSETWLEPALDTHPKDGPGQYVLKEKYKIGDKVYIFDGSLKPMIIGWPWDYSMDYLIGKTVTITSFYYRDSEEATQIAFYVQDENLRTWVVHKSWIVPADEPEIKSTCEKQESKMIDKEKLDKEKLDKEIAKIKSICEKLEQENKILDQERVRLEKVGKAQSKLLDGRLEDKKDLAEKASAISTLKEILSKKDAEIKHLKDKLVPTQEEELRAMRLREQERALARSSTLETARKTSALLDKYMTARGGVFPRQLHWRRIFSAMVVLAVMSGFVIYLLH